MNGQKVDQIFRELPGFHSGDSSPGCFHADDGNSHVSIIRTQSRKA